MTTLPLVALSLIALAASGVTHELASPRPPVEKLDVNSPETRLLAVMRVRELDRVAAEGACYRKLASVQSGSWRQRAAGSETMMYHLLVEVGPTWCTRKMPLDRLNVNASCRMKENHEHERCALEVAVERVQSA